MENSTSIETSDGKEFAEIIDVVGPTHMQPIIKDGIWKGSSQSEFVDEVEGN